MECAVEETAASRVGHMPSCGHVVEKEFPRSREILLTKRHVPDDKKSQVHCTELSTRYILRCC